MLLASQTFGQAMNGVEHSTMCYAWSMFDRMKQAVAGISSQEPNAFGNLHA
jgi:hypothetical protein